MSRKLSVSDSWMFCSTCLRTWILGFPNMGSLSRYQLDPMQHNIFEGQSTDRLAECRTHAQGREGASWSGLPPLPPWTSPEDYWSNYKNVNSIQYNWEIWVHLLRNSAELFWNFPIQNFDVCSQNIISCSAAKNQIIMFRTAFRVSKEALKGFKAIMNSRNQGDPCTPQKLIEAGYEADEFFERETTVFTSGYIIFCLSHVSCSV